MAAAGVNVAAPEASALLTLSQMPADISTALSPSRADACKGTYGFELRAIFIVNS